MYYIIIRTGIVEWRYPVGTWDEYKVFRFIENKDLHSAQSYSDYRRYRAPAFSPADQIDNEINKKFSRWDESGNNPVAEVNKLEEGVFKYFFHSFRNTGNPPRWFHNPITGITVPFNRHWSRISDFENGDIKVIWEPSRFSFVYTLVRAYGRTGDERYAERFWNLVEDWMNNNPPNRGPNWKCGQETSFRLFALCFGLYGFINSPSSTPGRISALASLIVFSGIRIESNLKYALSQRNNHAMSEAAGLFIIGVLFPELRQSKRWKQTGQKLLEDLALELIYEDGSFVQHSVNYHRLMLHVYLFALRAGEINGIEFSEKIKQRLRRSVDLLYNLQDVKSGGCPNYGSNDGSLILPLNNCDYTDYRPVIQALSYMLDRTVRYEDGPWNEDLYWMFGAIPHNAVDKPVKKELSASTGGYYTLRSESGFVFFRCAGLKDRPGQPDMLHLDVWWKGVNIFADAGTYSYNAPPPWNRNLGRTVYHNTVTVDFLDQSDKISNFLSAPRVTGRILERTTFLNGELPYIECTHNGYERLADPVRYRRGILRLHNDCWFVIDTLKGNEEHEYRLHWLIPDMQYRFDKEHSMIYLNTNAGPYSIFVSAGIDDQKISLCRADEKSPRGWWSPYYLCRKPAVSLALTKKDRNSRFVSAFGPSIKKVEINNNNINIDTDGFIYNVELSENNSKNQAAVINIIGNRVS